MSVVALPPDRLYFAVLDAPVARGRARSEELGYAFEACLPCPLESVHPSYRPLSDGRILAIGLRRNEAQSLPPHAMTAYPHQWPAWIDTLAASPPESVNLLCGDATPAAVRRQKSSIARAALITIAAAAALLTLGVERRIRAVDQERALAALAAREVYSAALGDGIDRSTQPPSAVMTSELRRLRATRLTEDSGNAVDDGADDVLASVLAAWPEGAEPQTESVTIAERSVELVLRVGDVEAAQRFVTSLGAIPGLSNASSLTAQDGDGIRLTLRLDRGVAP